MKNIINILLLSPVLFYVILLLINADLLSKKENVNIFWVWNLELPLITIISIFFVSYIFLMYFSGKFSSFFNDHKIKKLQEENLSLKAKIGDFIPEMEKKLDEKLEKLTKDFKEINDKSLELHKKETNKVLGNLEYEINNLKENIKNENTRG